MKKTYQDVIEFWFQKLTPADWWKKSADLDQLIYNEFGDLHRLATQSELWHWRTESYGCLAEVIILDQFSRNIYRDKPESFAFDGMSLVLAQEALQRGFDKQLTKVELPFLLMPFMHSESLIIHEQAIKLFTEAGLKGQIEFENRHKVIIDKFGRYPHRNKILGRTSTPEELEFLNQPNSSF